MKYLILLTAYFYFSFQLVNNTGSVLVRIEGIKENKGQIILNLYRSENGFPMNPKLSYREFVVPIVNSKSEYIIENLPMGEYAISAYHDENFNRKFDVNFFKIPIEKAGCSNNPKYNFMPSYDDAKFQLAEIQLVKTILIK